MKRIFLLLLYTISFSAYGAYIHAKEATIPNNTPEKKSTVHTIQKPVSLIILEKKASTGDPEAQFETGLFYFRGVNYPKNIPKAIHYLELAADQKHTKALYNLASLYLDGTIVAQNTAKGINFLERAMKENYAPAQVAYAFLYLDGKLVGQDIEKSYKYLYIAGKNKDLTREEVEEVKKYQENVAQRLTAEQVKTIENTVNTEKKS